MDSPKQTSWNKNKLVVLCVLAQSSLKQPWVEKKDATQLQNENMHTKETDADDVCNQNGFPSKNPTVNGWQISTLVLQHNGCVSV